MTAVQHVLAVALRLGTSYVGLVLGSLTVILVSMNFVATQQARTQLFRALRFEQSSFTREVGADYRPQTEERTIVIRFGGGLAESLREAVTSLAGSIPVVSSRIIEEARREDTARAAVLASGGGFGLSADAARAVAAQAVTSAGLSLPSLATGRGASASGEGSVVIGFVNTPTRTPVPSPPGVSATPTPQPPRATSSATPTVTTTPTPSVTPGPGTPSATPAATATSTPVGTATPLPSVTATVSATATAAVTGTVTASPSVSPSTTPSVTPSATPALTPTVTPSSTLTPVPTSTPTRTSVPTGTPTETPTATVVPTVTNTPSASPTATPTGCWLDLSVPGGAGSSQAIFASLPYLRPGDSVTRTCYVQNNGSLTIRYYLGTSSTSTDLIWTDPADGLQLSVVRNGAEVYRGSLSTPDQVLGLIVRGGQDRLDLTVRFPTSADNRYQGQSASVTFTFKSEGVP